MKIAIVSDIHDHIPLLSWFLTDITHREVSCIFGLGDYCNPSIIEHCAGINIPMYAVFGNCDKQKNLMRQIAQKRPHIHFFHNDHEGEIDMAGKKFFLTHFPDIAERAAESLSYDVVLHGHTHHARHEKIGTTSIINPGKFALYPHDTMSYAIYDTTNSTCMIREKK